MQRRSSRNRVRICVHNACIILLGRYGPSSPDALYVIEILGENCGAQGRNRTTDTVIFSLSYIDFYS